MLANSVVFFLFLTVIMPPFLALRGLRLLFNQPVCMNHGAWSPHVVSAACCLPACCEPDTTSWGPRTYTQTWWLGQRTMFVEHQANCEGVYLLCLNVCGWEPACAIGGVHAHFACFPRRMLGWIHAFSVCVCVCVCVCVLKGEWAFVQCICMFLQPSLWCLPLSGAAILLLSWCENFYFSILLSFPDGTQFPLSILLHNDIFWLS